MAFSSGTYTPKNMDKYIGKLPIKYRSSWELHFCRFCDDHSSIISWAYESMKIPYFNPVKNRQSIYIPDFYIEYKNKKGMIMQEIVEIKPHGQAVLNENKRKNKKNIFMIKTNHAKWAAAKKWCDLRGYKFRVITEKNMFSK